MHVHAAGRMSSSPAAVAELAAAGSAVLDRAGGAADDWTRKPAYFAMRAALLRHLLED